MLQVAILSRSLHEQDETVNLSGDGTNAGKGAFDPWKIVVGLHLAQPFDQSYPVTLVREGQIELITASH